jgi:hypothetical protein
MRRSTQTGCAAKFGDNGIRVIVSEDSAEVGAFFGHCLCPGLAKSDTVSLANSSQDDVLPLFSHDEGIAWDGAPA